MEASRLFKYLGQNPTDRVLAERAAIESTEPAKNLSLALRVMHWQPARTLLPPDLQSKLGPLVQQLYQALIELIDLLSPSVKAHKFHYSTTGLCPCQARANCL